MDFFIFFIGIVLLVVSIVYLIVTLIRKSFVSKIFFSLLAAGIILPIAGLSIGINDMPVEEAKVIEELAKPKAEPKKEEPKKEEPKKEEPKPEPKKEEPKKESPKIFNYTVESFTAAVNNTYASVGSDTTVSPILKEEENAATYMITSNTALITKHDEKGMINEVNVLFMMEGSTDLDAMNFLLASGVVIGVLNPELQNEERGAVLTQELNFMELLDEDQGYEMAFVGPNLYELTSSRSIGGIQLTVTPSGDAF